MSHHVKTILTAALFCLIFAHPVSAGELMAGASAVDITPYDFEIHPLSKGLLEPKYHRKAAFYDTGVDQLFDFEEPGALGPDGAPGIAGVDDDGDGVADNCTRESCGEYMAPGSDDVADPNHDNYNKKTNRAGTEGDGKLEFVHLGGFSPWYPAIFPNRLAIGVHDPLWARALAVQGTNGATTVLVSVDLPGLTWKNINPVRRRLEQEFKIPKGNIVIAATHDHYAPDGAGYWSTFMSDHNLWYMMRVREFTYQAAAQAIRSMQPAKMKVITTTHFSCQDRKTGELKKDPDCHLPPDKASIHSDDSKYDRVIMQMDQRDPVVRNTRIVAAQFLRKEPEATGADGAEQTIATFVNWNNHPDSMSSNQLLISSDYPNYLRQFIEKKLGGTAIYFTGTLGCQIGAHPGVPAPLWTEEMTRAQDADGKPILIDQDNWDRIRSIGYEVANEAVNALKGATAESDTVSVHVLSDDLDTAVDNFLHVVATRSVWTSGVDSLDQMRFYPGGCDNTLGCVRSDLAVIQIGSLGLATLPGEVDPAYFLGRKKMKVKYGGFHLDKSYPAIQGFDPIMPGRHHAVIGQANNYLSYLLPHSDNIGWWNFKHPNHYEELVTVSADFGDNAVLRLWEMLGKFNKGEESSMTLSETAENASENFSAPDLRNEERGAKANPLLIELMRRMDH
jgi:hypothetical protein